MLKTVGFPSTRTGDQTIVNGNLIIGTAGKGIDFSADPSAPGMTSELLDDYEEGEWTPVVGGTWAVNPTPLSSRYTKIGRTVNIICAFAGGSKISSTSGWLEGLPFAVGVPASGTAVDTDIVDRGQCLAANTDRVWLTANAFGAGINFVSVSYIV
jgi:hypothetical protein